MRVEGKPVHGFFSADKRGQKITQTLILSSKLRRPLNQAPNHADPIQIGQTIAWWSIIIN